MGSHTATSQKALLSPGESPHGMRRHGSASLSVHGHVFIPLSQCRHLSVIIRTHVFQQVSMILSGSSEAQPGAVEGNGSKLRIETKSPLFGQTSYWLLQGAFVK